MQTLTFLVTPPKKNVYFLVTFFLLHSHFCLKEDIFSVIKHGKEDKHLFYETTGASKSQRETGKDSKTYICHLKSILTLKAY